MSSDGMRLFFLLVSSIVYTANRAADPVEDKEDQRVSQHLAREGDIHPHGDKQAIINAE